jgi:hypothetical protein
MARIARDIRGLDGTFNGLHILSVRPKYVDPYKRIGLSWCVYGSCFGFHINTFSDPGYPTKEATKAFAITWFKAMERQADINLDKAIARAKLEWGPLGTAAVQANGMHLVGVLDSSLGRNVLVDKGVGTSFQEAFRNAEDRLLTEEAFRDKVREGHVIQEGIQR